MRPVLLALPGNERQAEALSRELGAEPGSFLLRRFPDDETYLRVDTELAGRDVYVREGCYNCHSQMVRTLRFETERYGHYSLAGESVYDHPFQWGSKRTGPDLARIGGRYSDDWHRVHLINPRDVVPESNLPSFPWLAENQVSGQQIAAWSPAATPSRASASAAPRGGFPTPRNWRG